MKAFATLVLLLMSAQEIAWAAPEPMPVTPARRPPAEVATEAFKDTVSLTGLLPIHLDDKGGRILLTLPPADAEGVSARFLYTPSLRTGLGSAPTLLDRGKVGETQVLAFRRIGKKVAAVFENPRFRGAGAPGARSPDFATSVVWMKDADKILPDGAMVVDIAPFLVSDAVGIASGLAQENAVDGITRGVGRGFKLDSGLSAADPASAKLFPQNFEVDAVQTYVSDTPGDEVANIAPDAKRVSFIVHHSFAALPPPGFAPRAFDPRIGGFATQGVDYGRPLGQDVVYDFANRFRLEKVDPAAPRSRVKKPIVFYVDRNAPEPLRAALVEGINWWAKAFAAAGYIDAFRAEVLPDGVDPMDIRYNIVNWVDRATRGWSYGQPITDPRTGEIVKGMVVLGSERVRHDIEIFQGLMGAGAIGKGGPNDPVQVGLARMRQLGAHEVGHALGFAHNFAASTQSRASVMDYPPPRIGFKDGQLDFSDAYGVGVGAWDMATTDWLYGEPPPGAGAQAAIDAKAAAVVMQGLRYVKDENARRADTAQAWGALWDDGPDPVAELNRIMTVRRAAVDRFGLANLMAGEAVANLRRRFVPVYLLHRYQLVAAAKQVGGVEFSYAVAGGGKEASPPVAAATQRAAIAAVLGAIAPEQLRVPAGLMPLLSAPRNGSNNLQFNVEVFRTAGGPVFDPLVAADVAVEIALNTLLAPGRLQRLEVQHAADSSMPGVSELLDTIEKQTMVPRTDALARRILWRTVVTLAQTAHNAATMPEIAALLGDRVHGIAEQLGRRKGDAAEHAWAAQLSRQLLDPAALEMLVAERPRTSDIPQGDPIGEADWMGTPEP
jgi:hypothetical protein